MSKQMSNTLNSEAMIIVIMLYQTGWDTSL
jgi:hypothetical protein